MELMHVIFIITTCLSGCCGQTAGIDTSDAPGISFLELTTAEYKRYCPYTETCIRDSNKVDGADLDKNRKGSCCEKCSCSDTCGLNCCPDKLFTFTNEKDFYDAEGFSRCFDAINKPFDDGRDIILSYEMISKCPFEYFDRRTAKQCRQEYNEFDFQMPLRNFLPVFDITKHRVYKNIFCAVCHNADKNDLEFAFLTYSCENRRENLTYLHELVWNVSKVDGSCYFRFFPKDRFEWFRQECDRYFITRCNETGWWKQYDRQLEEKCLSYKSDYQINDYRIYRNVHCFLCNGFSEGDILTVCPTPFTRILPFLRAFDFRNVFSKEKDNHHTQFTLLSSDDHGYILCQKEAIYNVSQVQNWILECPFGMVLYDDICYPPSLPETIKGTFVSVYVSLLLEPDHSRWMQHKISVFAFLSLMSTEVQKLFSGLVTRDIMSDYYITVSTASNLKPLIKRNTTIDFGLIKRILVHTKVTLAGIQDAILPILDFTLLFNTVTRIGNFKVKIRRQIPLANGNKNRFCLLQDYLFRNVLQCADFINDASNFYLRIPGAKANHNMPSGVIVGVEREPFCPRVALKKLAFVENTEPCNEFHELSQILTDDFLSKQLSENETHRFFCYKDYLQHLETLNSQVDTHRVKERNAEELAYIYLTIVCLSASVVSLLTTVIIYARFAVLRTLPGLNIMALSVTLIVYHLLSLVGTITHVDTPWLCSLIGIVTHFFMIQSFGWMFICTYHMMKVFIKIRSKAVPENILRTFIIYVMCAALVATTLVAITVVVAEVKSGGQDIGYGGKGCYIKNPFMIMYVAAIPVALVVILNFCQFCAVLFKISRLPSLATSKQKERQNTVIFVKLSTLTGLSSVFGFVFLFTDSEVYAFGYLYVILNGGQGVFIMISFIFNRRVMNLVQGPA